MDFGFLLFILMVVGGAILLFVYLQRREIRKAPVQTPYTEALHALLCEDKTRALQKLRETVQRDTANIDAYIRLGHLHLDMDNGARALKIHRMLTLRTDLTNVQRVEVYRALARDYVALADLPRALESLEQILRISKRDIPALREK
ncbi:MAG: hypothetical protein V1784_10030, partial [bacterium]